MNPSIDASGGQAGAAARSGIQLSDLIALAGSLAIMIGYAFLPLATNFQRGGSGGAFSDHRTTFLVLTACVGLIGFISAVVSILSVKERGIRWWYAGLGVLALVLFIDNTLLHERFLTPDAANRTGIWKLVFDAGGLVMLVGSLLLVVQVFVPRRDEVSSAQRTNDTILGLIRIVIATLWITQLLWKLPWNNYGCPAGDLVPAAGTTGLCDWVGREIREPRYGPYLSFLEGFVTPNLGWMAFFILAGEAFIGFSLLTGLFTRLGAIAGLAMGINLFVGLTAVRSPYEWDWTYLMLPALNAVFIAVGGRWVGLDALVHKPLARMVEHKRGGLPVRVLAWLTS